MSCFKTRMSFMHIYYDILQKSILCYLDSWLHNHKHKDKAVI